MFLILFMLLALKANVLDANERNENSLKNKFNKNQKELNEIQFYGDLQERQAKESNVPQKEIQHVEHNKELRHESERLAQRSIQNDGSPEMNKGVNMRDSYGEYFKLNPFKQSANSGGAGGSGGTSGGTTGGGTGGASGGASGGTSAKGVNFDKFLNALAGSETESGLGKPSQNTFVQGANNIYTVDPSASRGVPMYSNGISVTNHYNGDDGYSGTWQIGEDALRDNGFYYQDKTSTNIDFNGVTIDGKLAWSKSALSLLGLELNGNKITYANAGASQVLLNNRFITSLNLPTDKNPLTGMSILNFAGDIKYIMLAGRKDLSDNTSNAAGYVPTDDQYKNAVNLQATAIQTIMINNWNRYVVSEAYGIGPIATFIGKTIVVNKRSKEGYGIPAVGKMTFTFTAGAAIASCHLLGCGNVANFLKSGTLSADKNTLTIELDSITDGNLNISHYMAMYAGYETPFDANNKTTIYFGKAYTTFNPTDKDILPVVNKNADGSFSNGALSKVGPIGVSNAQKIYENVADAITMGTVTSETAGNDYTISTSNTYTDYVYAGLANRTITITGGSNFTNISASTGGGSTLEISNTLTQNFNVAPSDKLNVSAITAATNYTTLSAKLVVAYYDQANSSAFKAVAVSGLTTFSPGSEFYILYTDKTPAEIQTGGSVPTSGYTFKLTYNTANVQTSGTLTTFLNNLQNKFVFTAIADYTLTITAASATGNQIIYGSDNYKNVITGGAGNDYLVGGMKNDKIDGGAGFNILEGGKGADQFIVGKEATGTMINDFSIIEGDKINLARGFAQADINGATITSQAESVTQINTVTKAALRTDYNYDVLVGGKTINITSHDNKLTIEQIKANMVVVQ